MEMYNFLMMLWKAVFSLQSNVGKDTFDFITSEVFSLLPKGVIYKSEPVQSSEYILSGSRFGINKVLNPGV